MAQMNLIKNLIGGLALALVVGLFAGCQSYSYDQSSNAAFGPVPGVGGTNASTNIPAEARGVFNVGDLVRVTFSGIAEPPMPHEERVRDDGTITLPLIGSVIAKDKTPGDLQKEIHDKYINGKIFTPALNVTVSGLERLFFVGGEVRQPNRYPWTEGMTVLKAIQSAGDFTDFAKRSKVRLTRFNGQNTIVNCDKALEKPALDLPVYPGDRITVPRRGW
jgi:protein involved in polysaccharide export with SLBB domain